MPLAHVGNTAAGGVCSMWGTRLLQTRRSACCAREREREKERADQKEGLLRDPRASRSRKMMSLTRLSICRPRSPCLLAMSSRSCCLPFMRVGVHACWCACRCAGNQGNQGTCWCAGRCAGNESNEGTCWCASWNEGDEGYLRHARHERACSRTPEGRQLEFATRFRGWGLETPGVCYPGPRARGR